MHEPLHGPTSTAVGPGFTTQLVAGVPSTLTIEGARRGGNLRKGDDTPHFVHGYYGGEPQHKGASDYFLVVFDHQAMDYTFTTSTAIQTITINDVSIRSRPGVRRRPPVTTLRFAGRTTMDIPVNATAAAVEAPSRWRTTRLRRVRLARRAGRRRERGRGANHREWGASWRQHEAVTFLERLDEWAADSLASRCRLSEQGRRQVEDVSP